MDATTALSIAGTAVATAVGTLTLVRYLRREPAEIRIPDQPLRTRVEPAYVTQEHCATSHLEMQRNIDSHARSIEQIWDVIRQDRADAEVHASQRSASLYKTIDGVKDAMTAGFARLERSIGRIEGKIDTKSNDQ
jgi:hypothetical protein